MVEFISKNELKNQYSVLGNFYKIRLRDNTVINCRNDLHIIEKNYINNQLETRTPNLLMIMMNPGSSTPLESTHSIPTYDEEVVSSQLVSHLIPTKPDDTQYQVMRIMRNRNLNHARVINISDLINPDSKKFERFLREIHPKSDKHSIFCKDRFGELNEAITNLNEETIVFKAWGIGIVDNSKEFRRLVDCCLSSLENVRHIGIKGKTEKHFRHPLPPNVHKQRAWLESADEMIGNAN